MAYQYTTHPSVNISAYVLNVHHRTTKTTTSFSWYPSARVRVKNDGLELWGEPTVNNLRLAVINLLKTQTWITRTDFDFAELVERTTGHVVGKVTLNHHSNAVLPESTQKVSMKTFTEATMNVGCPNCGKVKPIDLAAYAHSGDKTCADCRKAGKAIRKPDGSRLNEATIRPGTSSEYHVQLKPIMGDWSDADHIPDLKDSYSRAELPALAARWSALKRQFPFGIRLIGTDGDIIAGPGASRSNFSEGVSPESQMLPHSSKGRDSNLNKQHPTPDQLITLLSDRFGCSWNNAKSQFEGWTKHAGGSQDRVTSVFKKAGVNMEKARQCSECNDCHGMYDPSQGSCLCHDNHCESVQVVRHLLNGRTPSAEEAFMHLMSQKAQTAILEMTRRITRTISEGSVRGKKLNEVFGGPMPPESIRILSRTSVENEFSS